MNYITHIGTAVPDHKIHQQDISSFMAQAHGLINGSEVRLNALYRATGIKTRYSVIEDYLGKKRNFYPSNNTLEPFPDTKARMLLYSREAINLASKSINDALEHNFQFDTITDIITVSCTGFYTPGLDFDIINRFGLNRNVSRTAVNYMGCYAAISAIRIGNAILDSNPKGKVLIVSVELCSIHFQKENTKDNRIANALFGDGAAAVLMESKPAPEGRSIGIKGFECDLIPEGEHDMSWNVGNLGFEMKLSSYVPSLIKNGMDKLLSAHSGISFKHFAIHPGGKKILQVCEEKLGISREENHHAHHILREYGNMSSPTIIFVLQSILESLTEKNKDDLIFGLAFGPGLTLESMVLNVH